MANVSNDGDVFRTKVDTCGDIEDSDSHVEAPNLDAPIDNLKTDPILSEVVDRGEESNNDSDGFKVRQTFESYLQHKQYDSVNHVQLRIKGSLTIEATKNTIPNENPTANPPYWLVLVCKSHYWLVLVCKSHYWLVLVCNLVKKQKSVGTEILNQFANRVNLKSK